MRITTGQRTNPIPQYPIPGQSRGTTVTRGLVDNPVGLKLFNYPSLPGEPGNWLIPNQNAPGNPNVFSPYNAFLPGTARFTSDQAVADLDWNVGAKDILAAKYYYQHDPSTSPYAYSNVPGFTAHMDTGSQVGSINNVQTIGSSLSISETVGDSPREGVRHERSSSSPRRTSA